LADAGLQQLPVADAGAASQQAPAVVGVEAPSQQADAAAAPLQQAVAVGSAAVAAPVTGNPLRAHFARPPSMLATAVKPWYIRK
jgi:hypothetical protein